MIGPTGAVSDDGVAHQASRPSAAPARAARRPSWSRLAVAPLAVLSLLAVACGGDDAGSASASADDPASTSADDVEPPGDGNGDSDTATETGDLESLAGRYAHFDVVAYEDELMKTLIISYGFADLEATDGGLTWTPSFCFSEHRSDQPISVEFSDAATSAIQPVSAVATVTVENGEVRISRPETPTGIGVRLDDPANDPLPTDPNDPRIADDDGDGNPGVTARITVTPELVGEIYLARREIFAYEVKLQADGSLIGHVDDESEQLVIGASDDIFLTNTEWEQHPDRSKSPLLLRPVESDWDCEQLAEARDELFPPTPEVDW